MRRHGNLGTTSPENLIGSCARPLLDTLSFFDSMTTNVDMEASRLHHPKFCLGPGGIDVVMDAMDSLYDLSEEVTGDSQFLLSLHARSSSITAAFSKFKDNVDRYLYAPQPFRSFSVLIEHKDKGGLLKVRIPYVLSLCLTY